MFKIKVVRKDAKVSIKNEDGKTVYILKTGSSVEVPEDQMGKIAKSVQGLLSIKPSMISVNKIADKKVVKKVVEKEPQTSGRKRVVRT